MKMIYLCDIDGTLTDNSERVRKTPCRECGILKRYHASDDHEFKMNWDDYHLNGLNDPPRDNVIRVINTLYMIGSMIVLLTGRPDTYFRDTNAWLYRENVHFNNMFMRVGNDHRPDTVLKAEWLEAIRARFPDVLIGGAFDDRPSVIRMWREKGITTFDVGKGVEF